MLRRWVGGCSAGVKSYDQGEAMRGWRVRLGTGEVVVVGVLGETGD